MIGRRAFIVQSAVGLVALGIRPSIAGSAADFEQTLAKAETDPTIFLGASGSLDAKELIQLKLATVSTSSAPKSKTKISDRANRLIVVAEVSGEAHYTKKLQGVIWPEGESGATIAMGYDLGYVKSDRFQKDWKSYISQSDLEKLNPACGLRGTKAKEFLPSLSGISIPWDVATKQFNKEVLPSYVWETENVLPNTRHLSEDSLGALVSLVYNRGASFNIPESADKTGRYEEMREIRRIMGKKKYDLIPEQIRKMTRLWNNDARFKGVVTRRNLEAELFELGLS